MGIQRYAKATNGMILPASKGEYVRHSDHVAHIAALVQACHAVCKAFSERKATMDEERKAINAAYDLCRAALDGQP